MARGITFSTFLSNFFSFLARGMPVPFCILPDSKGATIFLYLYSLLLDYDCAYEHSLLTIHFIC